VRKIVTRMALLATGLVTGLVCVGSALAGSTAADAHGSVAAQTAQALGAVNGQSTLPFTGLSLTLIVLVALLLVATGVGIRRVSHSRD
jgi:6,7-dimethyl-8-ribityllumazine synthase